MNRRQDFFGGKQTGFSMQSPFPVVAARFPLESNCIARLTGIDVEWEALSKGIETLDENSAIRQTAINEHSG